MVCHGELKTDKEKGPVSLPWVQSLGITKIFQVLIVGQHREGLIGSLQPGVLYSPHRNSVLLGEAYVKRKHLDASSGIPQNPAIIPLSPLHQRHLLPR